MNRLTKKSTKITLAVVLSIFLTAVMVLSGVGLYFSFKKNGKPDEIVNPIDWSVDSWDGSSSDGDNYVASFAGRSSSTRTIDSASSFVHFVNEVNSGNIPEGTKVYLNKSIDLKGYTIPAIGTIENPFKGTFDGGYYTILNANISGPALFAYAEDSTIENVGLYNCNITSGGNVAGLISQAVNTDIKNTFVRLGKVSSINNVAGLVGLYVVTDKKGTHTIENSFVDTTLSGVNTYGLVGEVFTAATSENTITINNCYFTNAEEAFGSIDDINNITGLDTIIANPTSELDFGSWGYDSDYNANTPWTDYDYAENSNELNFNFPILREYTKVYTTGSCYESVVSVNGNDGKDASSLAEAVSEVAQSQDGEIKFIVNSVVVDEEAKLAQDTTVTISSLKETTLIRGENNETSLVSSTATDAQIILGDLDATEDSNQLILDGNKDYVEENNLDSGALVTTYTDDIEIGANVVMQNNVNNTVGYGGAMLIYQEGEAREDASFTPNIKNCSATKYGGGLCYVGTALDTIGGKISGCHAEIGGGCIALLDEIEDSEAQTVLNELYGERALSPTRKTVSADYACAVELENGSGSYGGGIYCVGAYEININTGANIHTNSATYSGGGIYVRHADALLYLNDGLISNNKTTSTTTSTTYGGGGIYADCTDCCLWGGTITNNTTSTGSGGGVYYIGTGYFSTRDVIISNNSTTASSGRGGGVYLHNTPTNDVLMYQGTVITNNKSVSTGAGVCFYGSGTILDMRESIVSNNTVTGANPGGGIHLQSGELNLANCKINNNKAGGSGGGIYKSDVAYSASIDGCEIVGNTTGSSSGYGGGAYLYAKNIYVRSSSLISNNTAYYSGGGLYLSSSAGEASLYNVTVTNNKTTYLTSSDSYGGAGVYVNNNPTITISGCTISGNDTYANGAGVLSRSSATFTLSDTMIGSNFAQYNGGGICSYGSIELSTDCVVSKNSCLAAGGGLYVISSSATVTLTGGTFTDNEAGTNGGGVYAAGTCAITGTTVMISGNIATEKGGGIYADTLTMSAGTISNNKTIYSTANTNGYGNGGGIYTSGNTTVSGSARISGNTASQAGGGIYSAALTTITGAVEISGNKASGYVSSSASPYNTIGGGGIYTAASVTINTTAAGSEPIFANNTATYNGGAIATYNHAYIYCGTFTNNKVTGNYYGGAVYAYMALTISNTGSSGGTLDCATVFSNNSAYYGGAIYQNNTAYGVTITGAEINNNNARYYGGGLYLYTHTVTLTNVNIERNHSTSYYGGAYLFASSGKVTVDNCNILSNSSGSYYGGVYINKTSSITGDAVVITDSVIAYNTATQYGGVRAGSSYGVVSITDTVVEHNSTTSSSYGGAYIYTTYGSITLTGCDFNNNIAKGSYGGAYIYNSASSSSYTGAVTISNCNFNDNSATSSYGGAYVYGGQYATVSVTNSTIDGNSAGSGNGGGLYISAQGTGEDSLIINGLTIANNTVGNNTTATAAGGGLYLSRPSAATETTITNSNIFNNSCMYGGTSDYGGGGICASLGANNNMLILNNCSVDNNYSNYKGGGVYVSTGALKLTNKTIISGNTAAAAGGGVNANGVTLEGDVQVINNIARGANATGTSSYAQYGGGAILSRKSVVFERGTGDTEPTVSGNTSVYNGGGICAYTIVNITCGKITNNKVTGSSNTGGGIYSLGYIELGSTVEISENSVASASCAGGIATGSSESGNITISGTKIINNQGYGVYCALDFVDNGNSVISNNGMTGIYTAGTTTIGAGTEIRGNADTAIWSLSKVTINGTSTSRVTISDNGSTWGAAAIYMGDVGDTSEVTIQYADICNNVGRTGGALFFRGLPENIINISNCTINNNESYHGEGGAIYSNYCPLNISNTEICNNESADSHGGAIYSDAAVTITSCSVNGNYSSLDGGAIYTSKAVTTNGTNTFNNNTAFEGSGGAIYAGGVTTISGSTFENNSSYSHGGAVWVRQLKGITTSKFIDNQITESGSGGAVWAYITDTNGNVTINSTFTGNSSAGSNSSSGAGGALYLTCEAVGYVATTVTFGGSYSNNRTSVYSSEAFGGAIYLAHAATFNTVISSATFASNTAGMSGGAFYLKHSSGNDSLTVNSSKFTNNICGQTQGVGNGGAIATYNGNSTTLTITNSTFEANDGPYCSGGAVYSETAVSITGGTFKDNKTSAGGAGGAVYTTKSITTSGNIQVLGNSASGYDGGAFYATGSVTIGDVTAASGATFKDNVAGASGGAIYTSGGDITIGDNVSFVNNSAGSNGGAIGSGLVAVDLGTNVQFTKNSSSSYGGAISTSGPVTVGAGAKFEYNKATTDGSAIFGSVAVTLDEGGGQIFQFNETAGYTIFTNGTNGAFTCASVTISHNIGGGVQSIGGVQIAGGTFSNNTGDAIFAWGGTIAGATISNNGGVGIWGRADLTVESSTISGNAGGIVMETGNLTINGTSSSKVVISDNHGGYQTGPTSYEGGGIYVAGNATLSYVELTNNSSGGGGAAYVGGTATINAGCTFENNTAENSGGAIYSDSGNVTIGNGVIFKNNTAIGSGGAIGTTSSGAVTIGAGSSFINNTAGSDGGAILCYSLTINGTSESQVVFKNNSSNNSGGAVYVYTGATLTYAEFDYNIAGQDGGALYVSGMTGDHLTLKNNAAGTNGGGIYCASEVDFGNVEISNNVAGQDGGGLYIGTFGHHYDNEPVKITNNIAGRNGGGVYIVSDGSGSITYNLTVQYNYAEKDGGGIYTTNGLMMAMYSADVSYNVANRGAGIYAGAIELSNTTIKNNSAIKTPTGSTSAHGGGMYISGSGNVFLSSGTISGNSATGDGGGVYITTTALTLSLTGATITDNTAIGNGGGAYIYLDPQETTAWSIGATFTNNKATSGGGLYINDGYGRGNGSFAGAVISDNTATSDGGALYYNNNSSSSSTLAISNTTMQNNVAGSNGGAIYFAYSYGPVSLTNGTYSGNTATGYGGVIYNQYGGATLTTSSGTLTITDNKAFAGGVFYTESGSVTVTGANINNNTATSGNGGAIYCHGFSMNGGTLNDNTASNEGGAVYSMYSASLTNVTANRNSASSGGVAYVSGQYAVITISGGTYNNNTATYSGGAIYCGVPMEGTSSISNATFTGNNANGTSADGGAIYCGTRLTVTSVTMTNNTAGRNGGALYCGALTTLTSVTISNNTATGNGGGVYTTDALTLESGTLNDNTASAENSGSAIYTTENFTMSAGTISYNNGVAIYSERHIFIEGGKITYNNLGAVQAGGTLTINDGQIKHNSLFSVSADGNVTINGGEISYNNGYLIGSAVGSNANIIINGGEISHNSTEGSATIFTQNGTITITGGTIAGNTTLYGGCIAGAVINMSGGLVTGNIGVATNGSSGAAIFGTLYGTTSVTITGGTITYNEATGEDIETGGTAVFSEGTVTISETDGPVMIAYNTSITYGAIVGNNVIVNAGTIVHNRTTGTDMSGGGAVMAMETATINGGTISNNESLYGGGIFAMQVVISKWGVVKNNSVLEGGFGADICAMSAIQFTATEWTDSTDTLNIFVADPESLETSDVPLSVGAGATVMTTSSEAIATQVVGLVNLEPNLRVGVSGASLVVISSYYQITIDPNGGVIDTETPSSEPITAYVRNGYTEIYVGNYEASAAMYFTLTRTGYTATGIYRYLSSVDKYQYAIDLDSKEFVEPWTPSMGYTFYVLWEAVNYNITYELGGSVMEGTHGKLLGPAPSTYNVENISNIKIPSAERNGYYFTGWASSLEGLEFGDGMDSEGNIYYLINSIDELGDVILTATWTPVNYTITYNLNGGSVATANPTTYTIETANITLNNPTRTGYTFVGWTGTGLAAETTSVTIEQGSTGNRAYVAIWKEVVYTVSYVLDGGSVATANPTTYTIETASFTLNNPTKDGYTFLGWTGTGLTSVTETVTVAKGSTGDRTYTANWETVQYTVNWKNGTTVIETDEVNHNGQPEYNGATPTKATSGRYKYTFIGWSPDGGANVYTVFNTYRIKEDTNFEAQFKQEYANHLITVVSNNTALGTVTGTTNITASISANYEISFVDNVATVCGNKITATSIGNNMFTNWTIITNHSTETTTITANFSNDVVQIKLENTGAVNNFYGVMLTGEHTQNLYTSSFYVLRGSKYSLEVLADLTSDVANNEYQVIRVYLDGVLKETTASPMTTMLRSTILSNQAINDSHTVKYEYLEAYHTQFVIPTGTITGLNLAEKNSGTEVIVKGEGTEYTISKGTEVRFTIDTTPTTSEIYNLPGYKITKDGKETSEGLQGGNYLTYISFTHNTAYANYPTVGTYAYKLAAEGINVVRVDIRKWMPGPIPVPATITQVTLVDEYANVEIIEMPVSEAKQIILQEGRYEVQLKAGESTTLSELNTIFASFGEVEQVDGKYYLTVG